MQRAGKDMHTDRHAHRSTRTTYAVGSVDCVVMIFPQNPGLLSQYLVQNLKNVEGTSSPQHVVSIAATGLSQLTLQMQATPGVLETKKYLSSWDDFV